MLPETEVERVVRSDDVDVTSRWNPVFEAQPPVTRIYQEPPQPLVLKVDSSPHRSAEDARGPAP